MAPVNTIQMNNGRTIPILGLGTWQAQKDVARETIKAAIDMGYRHFDCAMVYQNEEDVGGAIREKIADNTVRREDIFIVTKLWNTYHRPDLVVKACKKSLANLGLDYIDLYLIHWPCAYQEHKEFFPRGPDGKILLLDNDFVDTWKEMEKCVELNLVKSIGLSNFNSQQIDRIIQNAKIKPAVIQIECHPYLNQKKLRAFCRDRGIVVTGYSPLGSPSRPWAKPTDLNVLTEPKINEIAQRINKTSAQVVLNYLVHLGVIPLPKSANKQRLLENMSIFDFELSDEDKATLESLNCNFRYCPLSDFRISCKRKIGGRKIMARVPEVRLNNGLQMPVIGLGTYSAFPEDTANVVKAAIDCGYRHFDSALVYRNEEYVGRAIREKIAEGVIDREDVFVVSKLWNTYHRPDLVKVGCRKTLENLDLGYVDLFLVHWPTAFQAADEIKFDKEGRQKVDAEVSILDYPEFFPIDENNKIIPGDVDYVDTWKAMEECVDEGMVRSIGVSNFNSLQIDRLLENATIKPVTNQIELNPYINQKKMIRFCADRDIRVTAYGPLGLQIPAADDLCPRLVDNPEILALARELGKTPAQVILRYLVQLDTVPIPKTSNISRLTENLSIFDFALDRRQMAVMDSLHSNRRLCVIPG